ncbi:MAG: PAS-domain containing protein, partial [Albidovulum sp.]|uniref:PAS-domain containing protein n=1 Tax=Albidovulum sp. TaxID=1872424 RepID=UPI003CAB2276
KQPVSCFSEPPEQTIFLFDGHELIDATGSARALLDNVPGPGSDWSRLAGYLSTRIHDFEELMAELPARRSVEAWGKDGRNIRLKAECLGERARLTITDLAAEGQAILVDALSHRAQDEELISLRETLEAAPVLIWRQDEAGVVVWANSAYLDRAAKQTDIDRDEMTWPIPVLFSGRTLDGTASRRQMLPKTEGAPERWYECHSYPTGTESLNFALPADATVKAETALREFIQTLTKTFAQLPIGLAIFDSHRQLALFNPALVDLTSVGADFLSARPTLFSFLDRLREARVIPEPKDYRSWRAEMAALEKAAASGHYEETWTLPTGHTYRVTGRPHPDGAVAFLFEDISAEITLTRHFRSEIELGQAVVNTLSEAIAVFSPAGELIMSNDAYDQLWGVETGVTLGTITITDSIRLWQGATEPSPVWGDVRDFVSVMDERAEWDAEVSLVTGEQLLCRIAPLTGGATLVGFDKSPAPPPLGRPGRNSGAGKRAPASA